MLARLGSPGAPSSGVQVPIYLQAPLPWASTALAAVTTGEVADGEPLALEGRRSPIHTTQCPVAK